MDLTIIFILIIILELLKITLQIKLLLNNMKEEDK